MKASEMRQKDSTALRALMKELATKLFQLRMMQGSGQLKKNHELKLVRNDIARVNTVLTELAKKGE